MLGIWGPQMVKMWKGQVPPVHLQPQLCPPRPGDRIMLVDDSNEDWWKVTWQGGEQRDPGRRPTIPHLQGCCPTFSPKAQRPPLLQPLAVAKPRTNTWDLLSLRPSRSQPCPSAHLTPIAMQKPPYWGFGYRQPRIWSLMALALNGLQV